MKWGFFGIDCTNLRKVYFPHSVTSIENYAFYNAVNLVDIYYAGTQEEWEQIPKRWRI